MSIDSFQTLVNHCYLEGNHWWQPFRKVFPFLTAQGITSDLSMAPGNPRANYYTGTELTATPLDYHKGLWHGGDVEPKQKYLHTVSLLAVSSAIAPCRIIICDYLLFYPLIDMDSLDEQFLDNTVQLPRYSDGYGVMGFLVATNPFSGGATFYINYTNHKGEDNRIVRVTSNTATNIGTIVHSGIGVGMYGAFLPTITGDYIRSVQSITFLGSNGGLGALVLCKPLVDLYIRETNAPAEWDLIRMCGGKLPIIYDGAYISMLIQPNGNASGQLLTGDMTFIWR